MKELKMIKVVQAVMDSWMNFAAIFLNYTCKYIKSVFF